MASARARKGWVYFVKPVGADGPVKIGHSSVPLNRLAMLRSWSPVALELVARFPASSDVEARLHAKFVDSRSHGEWFHPTPALTSLIADVLAGRLDVENLPPPRDIRNKAGSVGDGLGDLAGSLTKGVDRVRMLGQPIPVPVRAAWERFCGCRERAVAERDLADAVVIADFLATHSQLTTFARTALAARTKAGAE